MSPSACCFLQGSFAGKVSKQTAAEPQSSVGIEILGARGVPRKDGIIAGSKCFKDELLMSFVIRPHL